MASRTVKVFCDRAAQRELAQQYEKVEGYEAFGLYRMSAKQRDALARRQPVEDITDAYRIPVGRRKIDTSKPRVVANGSERAHPFYKGVKRPGPGKHHYLVQFIGPVKPAWLTRLKRLGADPRAPYCDFTYIVRASKAVLKKLIADPAVRWAGHLPHSARVDIGGRKLPRTKQLKSAYRVEFFDKADLRRGRAAVRRCGGRILDADEAAGILTVEIPEAKRERVIAAISAVHGVRAVRKRAFRRTSNNVAVPIMGGDADISAPGNLDGQGEIVAVCDTGLDTGDPDDMHPDFRGRVAAIRSYPLPAFYRQWLRNTRLDDGPADLDSGHGTHVAGSAVGSGTGSINTPGRRIRSFAPRARLVFQAVEQETLWRSAQDMRELGRYGLHGIPDDLRTLFRWAYQQGARIHSNSWGGGDPGEYDGQCQQLDEFVWQNPDLCVLVAAGNDGTDSAIDGRGVIDRGSVTSPGTAKNCITVGASENLRREFDSQRYGDWWPGDYPSLPYRTAPMANSEDQVVAFSSRGPTRDDRTKPDVVAPGTFILSTRSRVLSPQTMGWAPFPADSEYFYMGGTSMACPLVAGAVAALRQFLRRDVGYANPSAALLKAVLILGAEKVNVRRGEGEPRGGQMDNAQGYGRVNLRNIVIEPPQVNVYYLDDTTGLRTGQEDRFDIRVRSSSVPLRVSLAYSDWPGPALVNNLNVMLTDPNGNHRVGNAARGGPLVFDTKNNVEVAEVDAPRTGTWTLRIIGSNIVHGPQPYAFAVKGDVLM